MAGYWGSSINFVQSKSFWRLVSCDVTYNEFRRKFLKNHWEQKKKKREKEERRKGNGENKRPNEKEIISELLQVHYIIHCLSPTLFGLLWVSFLLWLFCPLFPCVLYLIGTAQVFHGTLGNLIWLSSIQIHGIFSLLFASLQFPAAGPFLWNNAMTAGARDQWKINSLHHGLWFEVAFINCCGGFLQVSHCEHCFCQSRKIRKVTFESLKRSWKKDQG